MKRWPGRDGSRQLLRMASATCLASMLVACAGGPRPDEKAPAIRDVIKGQRKSPEARKIPIIKSERIAPDAEKALEHYHALIKLRPDEETEAETRRRLADLNVQLDDLEGGTDNSEAKLKLAIKEYETLLDKRPDDSRNDRILYQLARANQNLGRSEVAIDTLEKLTTGFPDSPLTGDAHFRRADLLYRLKRYEEAEGEFATVMTFEERTPFAEPAQYMKGWSQYRQSKFDDAIATFFNILDRELSEPTPFDVEEAIKQVQRGKTDLARDSLRVVSLSFAALGGGQAVNESFEKNGDPRFYPLIYNALGETLLDRARYTEAAESYTAFTQRYANHELAPTFQSRVIESYAAGGFGDLVTQEKERYAVTYDPDAEYWGGRAPTEEVMTALRGHLEDLAKYNHSLAQEGEGKADEKFLIAAKWYKRLIQIFPQDSEIAEINFLLGDALLDGGKTFDAAEEYTVTAYDYPAHERSGEAALAAFQAYEKSANEVSQDQRPGALRIAVDSGIRLADTFDQHPAKLPVLSQSAQYLFELKALEEAITVSRRILDAGDKAPLVLRRNAWSVTAASEFELKDYPEAEIAYSEELKLIPPEDSDRVVVIEQLAASIYKQGEAAREADDLRKAVDDFLRVGRVTPTSKIRANADYDAASSLIILEDWPAAQTVLEEFRQRFPQNQLIGDVDKKLAVAYESDEKPAKAAEVFERISLRETEQPDVRQEAAWQAARLFDESRQSRDAFRTYQAYVKAYPRPMGRAMDARSQLVALSEARGDQATQAFWLKEIVAADLNAGGARTQETKTLAAKASLQLGRFDAAAARNISLTAPLKDSVAAKKAAMTSAIASFNQAAGYGFAETTTAATFEIAGLYRNFGQSLLKSERPANLSGLELDQYELLLEDQAYPFEENAIQTHEKNLKRINEGRYDQWIRKSAAALVEMVPGKYAKTEQRERFYDSLR